MPPIVLQGSEAGQVGEREAGRASDEEDEVLEDDFVDGPDVALLAHLLSGGAHAGQCLFLARVVGLPEGEEACARGALGPVARGGVEEPYLETLGAVDVFVPVLEAFLLDTGGGVRKGHEEGAGGVVAHRSPEAAAASQASFWNSRAISAEVSFWRSRRHFRQG